MTLQSYYNNYIAQLQNIYDTDEAESITNWVFEDVLLVKKHQIAVLEKQLSFTEENDLNDILERLLTHEPLQYILGYAYFYDLKFAINKSVLIPRPETEELCRLIVNYTKNSKPLHIIDMGTGSGCLAISLKKHLPHSEVTAIDISQEALDMAKQNAIENNVEVQFILDDILNPTYNFQDSKFDVIVSNPPYIKEDEKTSMNSNVLNHEPSLALFVPNDDALKFYHSILVFAQKHLAPKGKIYFEINAALSNEMLILCKNFGYTNSTVSKDMQGKDRIIIAC